jgi:hypothetical protein
MMKRVNGATLPEIMKATSWQPHTIRGFVSILGSKRRGEDRLVQERRGRADVEDREITSGNLSSKRRPCTGRIAWQGAGPSPGTQEALPSSCTEATDRACSAKLRRGLMPSRLIMEIKVVRFRPRRAAAPFGPPTTPSVRRRV